MNEGAIFLLIVGGDWNRTAIELFGADIQECLLGTYSDSEIVNWVRK